jgi:hypothetical protein
MARSEAEKKKPGFAAGLFTQDGDSFNAAGKFPRTFAPLRRRMRDARAAAGDDQAADLFDRGRRQWLTVDLLRVVEAAAQRDRRGDDGEDKDRAHDLSL